MRDGYYDLSGASVDLIKTDKMDDKIAIVSRIKVPRNKRGQGLASSLMQKVITDADEEGYLLVLAVEGYDDGLSNQALSEWYEKLGFEWATPGSSDFFSVNDLEKVGPDNGLVMIRQPRRA